MLTAVAQKCLFGSLRALARRILTCNAPAFLSQRSFGIAAEAFSSRRFMP